MYIHGSGIIGDRKMYVLGAMLAHHQGALFTSLREQLNARGFVVASIDYQLPLTRPGWRRSRTPSARRGLVRAHAADLGIDPNRIGVWSSSGRSQLSSLLGLAGSEARFDRDQYSDQSSAVQAAVDMFGPADLTDFDDSAPFGRFIVQVTLGRSTAARRSASPITYIGPDAPPFLILQGTEDSLVRPHQSAEFAQRLQTAGVPTTLIDVQGTGHILDTPGQRQSPDELTTTIIDFLTTTLR